MAVEARSAFVDRVHDQRAGTEVVGTGDRAGERVAKQVGAEFVAVLGLVEREASEEEHRHGIGLTPHESRRRNATWSHATGGLRLFEERTGKCQARPHAQ